MKPHVLQRADDSLALNEILFLRRIRHRALYTNHHLRRRTPAHLRLNGGTIKLNHFVEHRIIVAVERAPVFNRLVPGLAPGRKRTTFDILDGGVIHCHHTHPGTGFDGHITNGHPAFHAQITDRLATKLNGIAGTTSGADLADDRQNHILAGHTRAQLAVHLYQHVLHLLLDQALGRQNMLHFRRADTMSQTAKSAVSRSMRITADNAHARQRRTLLRPNHVHDALALILDLELENPEFVTVLVQRLHLSAGHRIHNAVDTFVTIRGRNVMIRSGNIGINPPRLAASQTKALKGLR